MLAACGPAADAARNCSADACADRLMFDGRKGKPECALHVVKGSDGDSPASEPATTELGAGLPSAGGSPLVPFAYPMFY
jgi:hypothetical protein